MAELILTLFLDGLMALLLVTTIVYCWKLNKRIHVLQDSKSELANIIQEFDLSTQKATQSIAEIHEATSRIAENMQHKIDKANYLADDLQFMIEKGSKLAGQGDSAMSAGRSRASTRDSGEESSEPARRTSTSTKRSSVESQSDQPKDKGRSSIDAMLKRVRGGSHEPETQTSEAGEKRERRQGARLRSRAEQELFEALKAGGGKG